MRRMVIGLWLAAMVAPVLAGCSHGFSGDNCSSPLAAVYTEQCNPNVRNTAD